MELCLLMRRCGFSFRRYSGGERQRVLSSKGLSNRRNCLMEVLAFELKSSSLFVFPTMEEALQKLYLIARYMVGLF